MSSDPVADAPPVHPPAPWLPLALFLSLIFWAGAFAAIRVGLRGYSPPSLAFLRFFVGSAAIGVMVVLMRPKLPRRRDLPLLLAAAVMGGPLYHISLNHAEVTVGAGPAALLINISPVMAALLATWILRERLGVLGWIGTLVCFGGAAVIALSKGFSGFDPRAVWIVLAAAAGAVYTVAQKPLLRSMSPLTFTVAAIWIGTVCLLPALPRALAEMRTAPAASTWAAIYMGVFPTAIAYAMWAKVISRMNVSRAVSFLYLTPVFAVIIAWLVLGEVPATIALIGGALVIGGVMLVNSSRSRKPIL